MTLTSKDNFIFSSIVKEFQLYDSNVGKLEDLIENFSNSRIDICKLFKMQKFNSESLELNKKILTDSINLNKFRMRNNEKNKIELRDKIIVNKKNIKEIKFNIKKLETILNDEKQQGRALHGALEIFLSREKFKVIKKIIFSEYKKVYTNYSNELIIKIKIKQCDERKNKIQKERHDFNNSIDRYNRKINIYRSALSEIRKSTISMSKKNDLYTIKIESIMNYKEIENTFRIEIYKYRM
ncbi:hypothetical protein KPL37_02455 [Clostridium frigoris]|uniref:Uncharacterized protein n=1 Tax=Clostridium frigoris TaxID=205327 RepID=A0ABS6BQT6_9CLOT|nr:hypothetical protein [Clostridium frigoris]MBU3158635.1 hypothetical protein [Clostridium frigoris]